MWFQVRRQVTSALFGSVNQNLAWISRACVHAVLEQTPIWEIEEEASASKSPAVFNPGPHGGTWVAGRSLARSQGSLKARLKVRSGLPVTRVSSENVLSLELNSARRHVPVPQKDLFSYRPP